MDSVLLELGALLRGRPTVESTDSEVAAWYDAKARLLRRIALVEDTPAEESALAAGQARAAARHAARLRRVRVEPALAPATTIRVAHRRDHHANQAFAHRPGYGTAA